MIENLLIATEHLAGFVIVMLTLCLLWFGTALIGRFFGTNPARQETTRLTVANHSTASNATEDDEISDELVAVYAAVATILDERHRIVSVRTAQSFWGIQGRRDIHSSHRIR